MFTASYLTLAGTPHGEPPRYTMRERAMAAHAAGIPSIGIRLDEPLDTGALRYAEIPEAEWVELSEPVTPGMADLLKAACDMGVTRLNTGICVRSTYRDVAANLRHLLDLTAPLGMTVAVEPVAFGMYRTITDIGRLLNAAQVPPDGRCGLLYDMWQITSSGPGAVWWQYRGKIAEIQVCGVRRREPRSPYRASQDRPLIADSDLDIRAWLRKLQDNIGGSGVPVSYEEPHAAWRELSLLQAAEAAAADMALLEDAAASQT